MKKYQIFILLGFVWASSANGKVFDYGKQSLSTYLKGSLGMTMLQKTAYQTGFQPTVLFNGNDGVNTAYSGEAGLAFTSPRNFTLRLGVELFYPSLTKDLDGADSSGNKLLTITSQVYAVIPQVNLEFFVKQGAKYHYYIGGGAGYAITTLKNTVTISSASVGVSDFIEEGSGWALMGQGYAGVEFAFFDSVGFSFDAGYRYLFVDNYKSNRDSVTPTGTYYKGNQIKNYDGTNRATNLSGPWVSGTFRIYFN